MQTALGPFSNGKMHSEFQTIVLELSIGLHDLCKSLVFLLFMYVSHISVLYFVKVSSSTLFQFIYKLEIFTPPSSKY